MPKRSGRAGRAPARAAPPAPRCARGTAPRAPPARAPPARRARAPRVRAPQARGARPAPRMHTSGSAGHRTCYFRRRSAYSLHEPQDRGVCLGPVPSGRTSPGAREGAAGGQRPGKIRRAEDGGGFGAPARARAARRSGAPRRPPAARRPSRPRAPAGAAPPCGSRAARAARRPAALSGSGWGRSGLVAAAQRPLGSAAGVICGVAQPSAPHRVAVAPRPGQPAELLLLATDAQAQACQRPRRTAESFLRVADLQAGDLAHLVRQLPLQLGIARLRTPRSPRRRAQHAARAAHGPPARLAGMLTPSAHTDLHALRQPLNVPAALLGKPQRLLRVDVRERRHA
jgi:hypothetical protein